MKFAEGYLTSFYRIVSRLCTRSPLTHRYTNYKCSFSLQQSEQPFVSLYQEKMRIVLTRSLQG